ncbi:PEGA domain-containing protein [Deinococcus hopiensis]|uniref:PEGA domain-containing protein n=1 Tax=Deinococcus hopiensis KR-140 TaxID=695939 RepID=A0A1W1VFY6_9DEIO|nr:PEGA domain-containing protein [Deinococcus hopiensis]SMB92226.1 PEGA domain-containing protein [Deinococcus hopiensis KR-140]
MKKLLMIPAAMLLSTASAATKISAQSIIVNPTQPDLSVSVRVDKDQSGSSNPNYRVGENIRISATVNRDAYVYLFNVDANGEVNQILPNQLGGNNFVKANTTVTFPRPDAKFTFTVGEDVGLNKVLALASLTELDLDQLSTFKTQQDQFATVTARGQQQLAQALSIVVNPLPQNSWVSDTAFFTVVAQNPVQTGSLFVGTNVANATVILNGQRLGSANSTFSNVRPGSYPVRVQAPGFRDFTTTVTIRANATTNLNVDFAQATTPAPVVSSDVTLSIRSNLNGARVFVDGREVGAVRNGALNVDVDPGAHEVVLIAPGYRTFVNTYNVQRDAQITITPSR